MMEQSKVLSVYELTHYIKATLEEDPSLRNILVKGEISNLKKHQSGHWYFSLKDDQSKISAVMFASNASKMKIRIEDGMSVVVTATIGVYEANGSYQLYVRDMQPLGVGLLYLKYEQLKKDLEKEGLFSVSYKKTIPTYPTTIVVISAPKGAAVKDVCTTIKRRYPLTKVILIPSLVQGEQAKYEIVRSLEMANRFYPSVIILARGGGSIEDLWAFNEEMVARAIIASKAPVISAIGHETDFTIADFVSSLRAATPTAAAEHATPNISDIALRLSDYKKRMIQSMIGNIQRNQERVTKLRHAGVFERPEYIYASKRMMLDSLMIHFDQSKRAFFKVLEDQNHSLVQTMSRVFLNQLAQTKQRFVQKPSELVNVYHRNTLEKEHRFSQLVTKLDALSPLKIMSRGYALPLDANEHIISSIMDIQVQDQIQVVFHDGKAKAIVIEKEIQNHGTSNTTNDI